MEFNFKNLGHASNVEVLRQYVDINKKSVIDIGCGSMTFSRELSSEGAAVIAIDPDPRQAELNRSVDFDSRSKIEFVEAGANSIPSDDRRQDGVFFCHSLHHIPANEYGKVFEEVRRVMKPDGFVYVIEPSGGPLNDVMRIFHDEEIARAAAWEALSQFAESFLNVNAIEYHTISKYRNWATFVENFASRSFNTDYSYMDICRPQVRKAFEANANRGASGYSFPANKRAVILSNSDARNSNEATIVDTR